MNREVKTIFGNIYNEFSRYQASVSATLSRYECDMETAKREAAKYKDESGELNARKSRLVSAARAEIRDADKNLHDTVTNDYVPKLRQELSRYVCGTVSRDFATTLRDYMDFNLTLTRPELDALLLQADGSYTGLRMLASVAEKSGFKVSTPRMDDYEAEISQIENAVRTPLLWAPNDHLSAAVDVLDDVPIRRADGTVAGSQGRPTSTTVLMSAYTLNTVYKSLLETGEKWAASFVPEITAFVPEKDDTGETISPEQQHAEAVQEANAQAVVKDTSAEDWARQRARERAEITTQNMEKYTI